MPENTRGNDEWDPRGLESVHFLLRSARRHGAGIVGGPDQRHPRTGAVHPRQEAASEQVHLTAAQLLETPGRRWYPVIDYSRCTNCMECIDFCLFGVYGVDRQDRILVESPDTCKKGCPACSRVCPEQAIIFPDHKTPAIAGAANESLGPRKIDLTQLFGGAEMLRLASEEPARELNQDGQKTHPKDDLDKLMDALDALDL